MRDKITWTNSKRKLSELIPWEINPAQIGKDEARRLEESLDEFGQVQAIAISPTGEIYDGHQRKTVWSASKKFGKDYTVDVRVSSRPLTEQERKKLVIYLRKGAVGEFDWDILANNFDVPDLLEWGFDEKELQLGGFDLDGDKPNDPGAQVDKAEELREKWGVQSGQLWKLGAHRLICGDCTDRAVVERVMGGEKAGAVVTDPPYGMDLDADYSALTSERSMGKGKAHAAVIGDDKPFDASTVAGCDCKEQFWFGADYYAKSLGDTERSGSWLVWDKRLTESADLMYGSCFELIWSKQKHKRDILRHKWAGFFTDGKERSYLHPTEKSTELIEDLINLTGDMPIIYDPFCGSGTTLVACERLGRKCRAIEISPAYVAVALQRWADLTGKTPELLQSDT